MKSKTPLLFGGIFVLLVVIFLVTSFRPREISKGAVPLFEGGKPDIDKLELSNNRKGTMIVENQNGVWNIIAPFEYKANQTSVKNFIDSILDAVIDGVVSESIEAQGEYSVSDSTGTILKLYSSGELVLDAIIGKTSSHVGHTYARKNDSNEICIWRGFFNPFGSKDINDWRDKTLYSFNPDDIISLIAVKGSEESRELILADSLWIYKENGKEKPVDQKKVSGLISLFASLNCDAFADEKDIGRVVEKGPDTKVSFSVRNGDTHSFDVWTPGEDDSGNRYLVRKENGDILLRFYSYRGEQIIINYDKLKPDETES